jgi:plasmid stabilization system protein ParE
MRVLVAWTVIARLDKEAAFYLRYTNEKTARKLTDDVLTAIKALKLRVGVHRTHEELPPNFMRVHVKPFYLFYRVDEDRNTVLVYALRGDRQKPMTPRTHKTLATKAERDNAELN